MKTLLVCAFAFITFSAAHAQLGQSEDATAKLFGKPFGIPRSAGAFKIVAYRTSSYDITAGYKDGKAVYFIYKVNSGVSWSPKEVQAALRDHDQGSTEDPAWSNYGGRWVLYGHKNCLAVVHPEQKSLVIWDSSSGLDDTAILTQNPL